MIRVCYDDVLDFLIGQAIDVDVTQQPAPQAAIGVRGTSRELSNDGRLLPTGAVNFSASSEKQQDRCGDRGARTGARLSSARTNSLRNFLYCSKTNMHVVILERLISDNIEVVQINLSI